MSETVAALLVDEIKGKGFYKKLSIRIYAFQRAGEIFLLLHATNPTDKRYKGHKGALSEKQLISLGEDLGTRLHDRAILILQGNLVSLKFVTAERYRSANDLTVSSDLDREGIMISVIDRASVFSYALQRLGEIQDQLKKPITCPA